MPYLVSVVCGGVQLTGNRHVLHVGLPAQARCLYPISNILLAQRAIRRDVVVVVAVASRATRAVDRSDISARDRDIISDAAAASVAQIVIVCG